MYTFGKIEEFAVRYELDNNYGGSWLFGKFGYWIGGNLVGDYEIGTSLRDVLMTLRTVVTDNGNRENVNLFYLSSAELYFRLDSALYGGETGEKSRYEELAENECWARFQVDIPVDIFDRWKVYLIDCPPDARIIYYSFDSQKIFEYKLQSGVFDQVITDAFNTLFDIYEMEVSQSSSG
jgi:hypothetical protein